MVNPNRANTEQELLGLLFFFFNKSYSAANLGNDKQQLALTVKLIYLHSGKEFITRCMALALLPCMLVNCHPN